MGSHPLNGDLAKALGSFADYFSAAIFLAYIKEELREAATIDVHNTKSPYHKGQRAMHQCVERLI